MLSGPPRQNGVTVAVALPPTAASPAPAETQPPVAPAGASPDAMVQETAPQPTGKLPDFNGGALLPAPDGDLIEKGPNGYLPVIGRDGRQPWQVYARPFDLADKRPRVAIVIYDLGPSATMIDTAINHLPGGVSLGFVPYRARLGEWINLARSAGHEVLLNLPMEPANYPTDDPGPEALLTALDPPANLERLNWVMSQATGYVGVIALMGSRFSTSHDDMLPILTALQHRGLLYVDNRASPQSVVPDIAGDIGLAVTFSNRQLDTEQTVPRSTRSWPSSKTSPSAMAAPSASPIRCRS
ncbi:MAG: divergent polysaccharide deacetylase family protein [Aliidongia sp.]